MDRINKKNSGKKTCLIVTSVVLALGVLVLVLALTLSSSADSGEKKHVLVQTTTSVPVSSEEDFPTETKNVSTLDETLSHLGSELEEKFGEDLENSSAYKSYLELISHLNAEAPEEKAPEDKASEDNQKSESSNEAEPKGETTPACPSNNGSSDGADQTPKGEETQHDAEKDTKNDKTKSEDEKNLKGSK